MPYTRQITDRVLCGEGVEGYRHDSSSGHDVCCYTIPAETGSPACIAAGPSAPSVASVVEYLKGLRDLAQCYYASRG